MRRAAKKCDAADAPAARDQCSTVKLKRQKSKSKTRKTEMHPMHPQHVLKKAVTDDAIKEKPRLAMASPDEAEEQQTL